MAELVADTTATAAREAAKAAAKKIEDLCPQLTAKQAETNAAREAVERQAAEATEAAQFTMATSASLREVAALEDQLAALQAAPAPAPPGGDPNSRVADFLAWLGKLSRALAFQSASSAADITALSRDEVAALAPETESSRLARCKKAATEESDSDSAEGGVHQLLCGPDPDRED